jgi:hypothetical protein
MPDGLISASVGTEIAADFRERLLSSAKSLFAHATRAEFDRRGALMRCECQPMPPVIGRKVP